MSTAFAYARVSTRDQALRDNSIPAQFDRINNFASNNGIEIQGYYQDSDSAFHDENREQFQAMITAAIKSRPDFILVDDSSRFARTKKRSIDTKALIRKHGVDVRFINEPYIDYRTSSGAWLEGIQEIKNEVASMEIAFHTIKGMSHNLKARDSETGWCYKNGGKAPYGYKTVHLTRGYDHKGKPIIKTIWELDPETSQIVREIIVDMFVQKKYSYRQIRDELNSRGIQGPRGGPWATTTILEILKENRLEQYEGTAFWNKEDKHTIGKKYNPREQWVIAKNAHPAIITEEELVLALERKKMNQYNAPDGATRKSTYLLTGNNFEGKPLFICKECGGNVMGYGNSSHDWKKYICGVNRTRGQFACNNKWLVDVRWLEQKIIAEIQSRYTTPKKVDELIKDISNRIHIKNKDIDKLIANVEKQIKACDTDIQRLLSAIKAGIDPNLITDEINKSKQKKDQLEENLITLKKSYSKETNIDINQLRETSLLTSK